MKLKEFFKKAEKAALDMYNDYVSDDVVDVLCILLKQDYKDPIVRSNIEKQAKLILNNENKGLIKEAFLGETFTLGRSIVASPLAAGLSLLFILFVGLPIALTYLSSHFTTKTMQTKLPSVDEEDYKTDIAAARAAMSEYRRSRKKLEDEEDIS
jgi:hypothetical protein